MEASLEEVPAALRSVRDEAPPATANPPAPAPCAHWLPGQREAWHAELPAPAWDEAAATLGLSDAAKRYVLDGVGDAASAAAGIERPRGPRIGVWRSKPWLDLVLGYGPAAISRLFGIGGGSWRTTPEALRGFVAAHELEVARIVRAFPPSLVDDLLSALSPIADIRIAELAAHRLLQVGAGVKLGEAALGWLLANPEHAAWALTASALNEEGGGGKAKAARLGLHELATRGHRAAIEEAAREFGVDPELLLVVRETKELPRFWQPDRIAGPVLVNGKRLPTASLEAFVRLHASRDVRAAEQLTELVPAFTRESLERFAMEIFDAAIWRPKSRTTELWPEVLGRYGGDAAVEALAGKLVSEWAEDETLLKTSCTVLQEIGTPRAILELAQLADKRRAHEGMNPAQDAAEAALTTMARDRGTTPRALVGKAVAAVGRGVTRTRTLSFGPRAFRAELDSRLSLVLVDDEGAHIEQLPRPRKSDDEAAVLVAKQQLQQLRAEVRFVGPVALALLEDDLVQGRQWRIETLETWLRVDEVFRHLARHLVWGLWSGADELVSPALIETDKLRPIDDRGLGADRVGLLHPVELTDDTLSRLREIAARAGLQPPFAQLAREVFRPSPEELQAGAVTRIAGARLRLRRPLLRGWRQGPVDEGSAHMYSIERRFDGGVTAELVHSGIDCGDAPPSSVKLEVLRFRGAAGLLALSEVPARCLSEAVRDASEIASGG
ncbi:MAG: DUF4132 domain-containing protein [Myxococcota bacterium]|nr:DUF4132 domain-containing protein [Myxococcota bacterium]